MFERVKDILGSSVKDRGAPDGLSYLGGGSDRTVYLIENDRYGRKFRGKVVKIAKTQEKVENNRLEYQTWQSVKDTDIGKEFNPIRKVDEEFRYVIMDYVKPSFSSDAEKKKALNEARKLREALDYPDIHIENLGKHPELGFVLYDYPWGKI